MAETIIINGDLVGRDNLISGTSPEIDALIAAKLKDKREEAEREAAEDKNETPNTSGGVTIKGGTITIGGRVVSGDLIVKHDDK